MQRNKLAASASPSHRVGDKTFNMHRESRPLSSVSLHPLPSLHLVVNVSRTLPVFGTWCQYQKRKIKFPQKQEIYECCTGGPNYSEVQVLLLDLAAKRA